MNRLSGPNWLAAASASKVGPMPKLPTMCAAIGISELASDRPRRLEARQVDLAAHDHRHELVVGGEVLLLDAARVGRILIAGHVAGALEVAEDGAASRVGHSLDRRVGVLGRVMDLRDVVHRRDAAVDLAERRRTAR